jgi:DNA-binding response OmpR family regulator
MQYIATHPDMIITDIMLPGTNGIDLCKKIKEQDYFIPIIMLTALGTTNEKVEGFDAGADDYMVKPFEMKELLARIKALHKRSQYAPHENILKVEDLEVNLKTKQVMRAGNAIDLTPKEFNLLTYMLNNKGRVLSKSEIAEKVWDTKFDTGTNFIDVYISYLRRKIDKDYSKKLIQTKNGMGYILISHENPD